MSYLVINCFHWIGFHIVNTLLEAGYRVDGIEDTTEKNIDHLSMQIGRNSSFSLISLEEIDEYNTTFIIGELDWEQKIKSERILNIQKSKKTRSVTNKSNTLFVRLPLLFGEWMPMDDKGIYRDKEYILFKSDFFQTNAVYIKDFVNNLLTKLTSTPIIHTSKNNEMNELILENTAILDDNVSIDTKIEAVLSHYHRFREFY